MRAFSVRVEGGRVKKSHVRVYILYRVCQRNGVTRITASRAAIDCMTKIMLREQDLSKGTTSFSSLPEDTGADILPDPGRVTQIRGCALYPKDIGMTRVAN